MKFWKQGRRQIVGFVYPGDLIGLGSQGEHVVNTQAVKPTRLRRLAQGYRPDTTLGSVLNKEKVSSLHDLLN